MNVSRLKFPLLLLVLLIGACQEDLSFVGSQAEDIMTPSYPNVDPELWPFFESFENEAALRNLRVDLAQERIFGTIEPIAEADVVGTCSYGGFSPGKVVIDDSFWQRAGYYSKEMIVFHELGHCFLFRDHLEGQRPNGSCVSIMRSGLQRCRDIYSNTTQDYYLDELFSVNNRTN